MVVGSSSTKQGLPSWIGATAATRTATAVDLDRSSPAASTAMANGEAQQSHHANSDVDLGFVERTFSAAGAAVVSAILVNPLDVAKTRLQAQAAGVPYDGICRMGSFGGHSMLDVFRTEISCPPDSTRYKGTLDVLSKVIRQEGLARLWRGTMASLALAIPSVGIYLPLYDIFRNSMEEYTLHGAPIVTPYVPLVAGSLARSVACITCYPVELARTRMQAFRDVPNGVKPPGVLKTLVGIISPVRSANGHQHSIQVYRTLWTGLGAQLARDVPFSAICWGTLEPVRRKVLGLTSNEASAGSILGANFCGGFIAGSLAAAVTCPLDVARTRRQIENDPERALKMTTRRTLIEIWRDGGMKGLFTGVGPRVARAGPSVGIVVSFYEVVKYTLHNR
ncbi:PREDICTED: mitochondrial carrier protein MTM1-like isoform X2 [Ipomoea nil]|uniref:mitochondrial carrier protein MTM1-like isoform X2 n=1 Tax=Ipomoea nil TaxID=35883 RepID=UPI000901742A|nr:PREDICTED: mitochondrial carrier protein MTM1-like isoform X2 [Ipomoea nil]